MKLRNYPVIQINLVVTMDTRLELFELKPLKSIMTYRAYQSDIRTMNCAYAGLTFSTASCVNNMNTSFWECRECKQTVNC